MLSRMATSTIRPVLRRWAALILATLTACGGGGSPTAPTAPPAEAGPVPATDAVWSAPVQAMYLPPSYAGPAPVFADPLPNQEPASSPFLGTLLPGVAGDLLGLWSNGPRGEEGFVRRDASGRWSATPVPPPGAAAQRLFVTLRPDGPGVAAQANAAGTAIEALRYVDGAWQGAGTVSLAPFRLSGNRSTSGGPKFAALPDGSAIRAVLLTQGDQSVAVYRWDASAQAGTLALLPGGNNSDSLVAVGMQADGRALVVSERAQGSFSLMEIVAWEYTPATGWTGPRAIPGYAGTALQGGLTPPAAVGVYGNLVADPATGAFCLPVARNRSGIHAGSLSVYCHARTGGWSTLTRFDDPVADIAPLLAFNDRGDAMVTWLHAADPAPDGTVATTRWASVRARDGGWGTPRQILSFARITGIVSADIDTQGRVALLALDGSAVKGLYYSPALRGWSAPVTLGRGGGGLYLRRDSLDRLIGVWAEPGGGVSRLNEAVLLPR